MPLPFAISIATLGLVQAALVAAPRGAPPFAPLARLGSRWWGLVLPLPIVAVVVAIGLDPASADFLTYLALVAVPPLAGLALAHLIRGARPWLALLAPPLFGLAWVAPGSLGGQAAALALSGLACVSLGWLAISLAPERWLRLGIYAMAVIDAWLIGSDLLQEPNATLNAAAPGAGLPRLQFVSFGSAVMGFGDLFVAAVLGALLAGQRQRKQERQLKGAVLTAVFALVFDLLFLAVAELPATVPVALALAVLEGIERRRGRRGPGPPR